MPKWVKLTPKEKKFTKAYIKTGNATEAAAQAYNTNNRVTAWAMGYENLKKPQIRNRLAELGELAEWIYMEALWTWMIQWEKVNKKLILDVAHRCHDKSKGKAADIIKQETTMTVNFKELTDEELEKLIE